MGKHEQRETQTSSQSHRIAAPVISAAVLTLLAHPHPSCLQPSPGEAAGEKQRLAPEKPPDKIISVSKRAASCR